MFCGIKLGLITWAILFVLKLQLVFGEPRVPCYFIFGDSIVESGNNNNLPTTAKTNYPPYGIDFINGTPTGRFTNGRTIVDFIAQLLGFIDLIPTFATASGNAILRGVNYASGASGIRGETGLQAGRVISLNEQIANHLITVSHINLLQGNTTFTNEYLSKCLYTVNIGSNDYINNYLRSEFYLSSYIFTPQDWADLLIRSYNRQLRALYNTGARKIAIFGIGSLGCTPSQIGMNGANASGCVDNTNNIVRLFDNQLKPLVQQLNLELPGANFTFINTTSVSSGNPSAAGITVVNAPCCTVSSLTGLCIIHSVPCPNRNQYAFYDAFHPTEILNNGTATRSYIAQSPSDAYPFDISRLVMH